MDSRSAGVVVIAIGAIIVVGGLLVLSGGLSWLGRLPGDIRIERESFKLYIPVVSMLLVSALLSAVLWIVRRFR
jgi:H+/Cl- antiporter ClcA